MRSLSARNPRVQRLTRLVKRREERAEQRALVVEGPVLVATALEAGRTPRELYLDEASLSRPAVVDLLDRLPASVDPWVLPAGVLDRVGDVATSQGVVAVVDQVDAPWPTPGTAPFVVVLAELQIPGNVGTLVRAAAAAGAGAVICAGGADPTSPKVVRASAGAVFGIDVIGVADPFDVVTRLQADGYRVAAAVVDGGVPHDQADLSAPLAVVLGSEAHGLAGDVSELADQRVTIAMAGSTESLNVAMAGTVLCFEVLRRVRSDQ